MRTRSTRAEWSMILVGRFHALSGTLFDFCFQFLLASVMFARIEKIDLFGAELRRRVRDLVSFVEERDAEVGKLVWLQTRDDLEAPLPFFVTLMTNDLTALSCSPTCSSSNAKKRTFETLPVPRSSGSRYSSATPMKSASRSLALSENEVTDDVRSESR